MPYVHINWWAVVIAAIINILLGSLWYSKGWFGKDWTKYTGRRLEQMGSGGTGYVVASIAALIQSWILAHFVVYAGSANFWKGMVTGFWLWVGFIAVYAAVNVVFEGRSWALWRINAGCYLAILLITGGLLASWH